MGGLRGPGPQHYFGSRELTFSKASPPGSLSCLPLPHPVSCQEGFLPLLTSISVPCPQSCLSLLAGHPAHTLKLMSASEGLSPASPPWVTVLLLSLVCLHKSLTASFPVSGAGHTVGGKRRDASKSQKPAFCRNRTAVAPTLGKADLGGLTDPLALLHCSPPHTPQLKQNKKTTKKLGLAFLDR